MTIRYTCDECESVLKIRDDLAGAEAKCPKCKAPFRIPTPKSRGAKSTTEPAPESLDDLVDMPLEVTPQVVLHDSEEFDPANVLIGGSGSSAGLTTPEEDDAPRPSVAELMREHEEKQKAKKAKKESTSKKGGLAEAAVVADAYTAGTATDALTRTYDQKRGKASDAPKLTREEQRQADYATARKDFVVKAAPPLTAVLILGYFLIAWAFSAALPDLEQVTGVVTFNGAPLPDIHVVFSPIESPSGEEAAPSTGYTDSEGKYIMMFSPEHEGVVPGQHRVTLESISGLMLNVPADMAQVTVTEGEDHTFDFRF